MSAALPISNRSLKSRNWHWFLVTEFLTCVWGSKVNASFLGLTGMKFGSQVCVVSPKAVLALTEDYLHVQTRQWCSHALSTQIGTDFAGAKCKHPQLITCQKSWPRLEICDLLGCGTSYHVPWQLCRASLGAWRKTERRW